MATSIQKPPNGREDHCMEWVLDTLVDAIAARLEHRVGIRERLLDLTTTAKYLGLSEEAVRDLVAQGRLTPVRPTRKVQFDIRDLDAFIDSLKNSG